VAPDRYNEKKIQCVIIVGMITVENFFNNLIKKVATAKCHSVVQTTEVSIRVIIVL